MKSKFLKHKIYLAFKLIFIIKQTCQHEISVLYTPFYLNKLDFSEQSSAPLYLKTNQFTSNIYVSLGNSGIMIIDESGKNIIFQQNLNNTFINSFDLSQDGNYIIAGVKQNLIIYRNENNSKNISQYNFTEISRANFPTDIFYICYSQQKQIIVAAGRDGYVVVYDSQNMGNIKQLDEFNTKSALINNIQISQDGQWLYLGCDYLGTAILQFLEEEVQNVNLNQDNSIKRKGKLELAAQGKGTLNTQFSIATKDNEYVYEIDTWYGLYYSKCKDILYRQKGDDPIKLTFNSYWPFTTKSPTCSIMILSNDDKYILIGARSQGIIILDNSDRENIKLFQIIQVETFVYSMALSINQEYIYLSNSVNIFTFAQTKPNLNNNYPNLFNTLQAKEEVIKGDYKWRCLVDQKNSFLIGLFDLSGLFIIPFYNDPFHLRISSMKVLEEFLDYAHLDPSEKYLIFSRVFSKDLIGIYQIAPLDENDEEEKKISLLNPKLVYNYTLDSIQISETFIFSYDRKYAIATYGIGIILFDTSNILDIKLLQYWKNQLNVQGENQGACITRDNKYIFGTIRLQGVYVLNAQNKTNLVFSDFIMTFGGEGIQMSEISDLYAYLIDGIKGFAIIDLTKLPHIIILSRVQLKGWSVMAMLLQNETYALVTQMETGMLSLIDIKDKKNPLLISTFQYKNFYANAICGPKNNEYIFITTPKSIITLPLVSKVNIHTEVYEIFTNQITGQQKFQKLNKEQNVRIFNQLSGEYTLLVGQQIQFSFAFIYPQHDGMYILEIKQYKDGNVSDLPDFFTYSSQDQILSLNVCKEQLNNDDRMISKLNTFLINTVVPLVSSQFLYSSIDIQDKAITNKEQSELILEHLIDKNIIDSSYILSNNFDSSKKINLDRVFVQQIIDPKQELSSEQFNIISSQLQEKIKQTLLRSISVNPVQYYVKNSLIVDFQNKTALIQSPYSSSVTIQISVRKKIGKFVHFNYLGVVSSVSEEQDEIKIEGTLESVNKVLQQGVLFAYLSNLDNKLSQSIPNQINIQVIDNVNYRISLSIPIQEFQFIYLKEPIKTNQVSTLQQQIDKQFEDSIVYIETDVSFTFAEDSFIVTNSSTVECQIFYQIGDIIEIDQYKELTADLWIQFQFDSRLNFRGTLKSEQYREIYHFKIVASDGYSQTEDYFSLKVYGVPFLYIFNILLKVLGPLIAFLGLYQKRFLFYNMIFKKKVTFEEEIAYCNQNYRKQIILLGKILQDSKMITHQLFSKINQMNYYNEKIELKKIKRIENKLYEAQKQINKSVLDKVNQNVDGSDLSILKVNAYSQDLYEQAMKKYSQNYISSNRFSQISNTKKFIEQIQLLKPHITQTKIEKRYLKSNGSISMSSIINDIFQLDLLNQLPNSLNSKIIQEYTIDLKNNSSRIYYSVRAFAARYLLNLNKRSLMVYDYIKYYCQNNDSNNISANDWQKVIVDFQYKKQKITDTSPAIFPNLEIKCDILLKILSNIKLIELDDFIQIKTFEQIIQFSETNKLNINLFLIKEVLFADMLGFCSYIPSGFQPSVGQSIHLHAHDIKFIIAYKKINYKKWLQSILTFFNLDYARYGVSKNMRLPSWIYLDQKHNLITFEGIPQRQDQDEIQIRIYDTTGYVIKQFLLKIIPEQNSLVNLMSSTIPDEQDHVESRLQIQEHQKPIHFNRQFSVLNTFISQKGSLQKIKESNPNKKYSDINESPNLTIISPKQPSQLRFYEFSKQSNSKNVNTKISNDTMDDLLTQKTNKNYYLEETQY